MFRELRNRFIGMTMLATTVIMVVAFLAVFAGVKASIEARGHEELPVELQGKMSEEMFREVMEREEEHLKILALNLAVVGLIIEAVMLVVSYNYAERSIRPVRRAYEQQRDFVANASHELKTPIAIIRANFEALEATEEPWATNIDNELTRVQQLVTDMLTLARTNDVAVKQPKQGVDLTRVVKGRAKVMGARLGEKELRLIMPEKLEIETYGEDFEQILNILLDNATKYAKSWVEVELTRDSLTVRNDGDTIPEKKLERIFERFYQVNKTTSGTGLGLAIAKTIADKHHWKLVARSEKRVIEFELGLK